MPNIYTSPTGEVGGYAWAGALKERVFAYEAIAFDQGAWPGMASGTSGSLKRTTQTD